MARKRPDNNAMNRSRGAGRFWNGQSIAATRLSLPLSASTKLRGHLNASMKTIQLLEELAALIRQPALKIRVNHENLETVYLEPTSDGRVLVHDRGHAHTYLSTKNDKTYRDWNDIGIEHIRKHCNRLQLTLENLLGDDSDSGFCICGRAVTDLEVAELVNRIAVCQDEIFQSAYRDKN